MVDFIPLVLPVYSRVDGSDAIPQEPVDAVGPFQLIYQLKKFITKHQHKIVIRWVT